MGAAANGGAATGVEAMETAAVNGAVVTAAKA